MAPEGMGRLQRWDRSGWPLLVARLVVGTVFVWLGLAKVGDPVAFLKLIREYGLVAEGQPWLLNGLAVALPWLEIWCGVLLLLGVGVRGAAVVALVMLTLFTGAIALRAVGIWQGEGLAFCDIKFDCGCGSGEQYVCRKLPENVGLLLLSTVTLVSRSSRFCLRREL